MWNRYHQFLHNYVKKNKQTNKYSNTNVWKYEYVLMMMMMTTTTTVVVVVVVVVI